jgi:hypothetical protein
VRRWADLARLRSRVGAGTALTIAALVVFVALWFSVLIGQKVLLGGDVLYQFLPWSAEPGAHAPANIIVNDPILQMLPWQQFVADQIAKGQLPLWNPSAQNGVPLLANDAAAVFSPFTWFALLFSPAIGLSLAMLLKLLVAGLGMAVYVRSLKAGGLAAAFAGIAYSASSFIVVWLAWPQSGVAALMPWAFAFTELWLGAKKAWALPALALALGLQFLAGNAETSLHLGFALGLYAIARWALSDRRWWPIAGLAAAAGLGAVLAGIQLVPFVDLLSHAALLSARSTQGLGFTHLGVGALSTWIFPNALGNPALDGSLGRPPNYNEATGFAGVAALVMSPVGVLWAWRKDRSLAVALAGIGLVSAGIVYGPLTPLSGRLPGLDNSNNERLLLVICFAVAALGGLGLQGLLDWPPRRIFSLARPAALVGALGVLALCAAGLALAFSGHNFDHALPRIHGYIGFWLVMGAAALGTAVCFAASGLFGSERRIAAAGLCALALVEAAIFAGPFNPREAPSSVPPTSPSMTWLQAHAGGQAVTALGTAMIPETASLYGLTDARGYEILTDPRERLFWSTADPGYTDLTLIMKFEQPGADWLAAAGVAYVLMPAATSIPGTTTVYQQSGVAIAAVPDPRPFAYAAGSVVTANGPDQAISMLAAAPLGPVVVEGCCPAEGSATVEVTRRDPGAIDLSVTAEQAATIVVQQSFQPGWEATVDGRSTEIMPANVLFQAVQVPAGTHLVTLRYRPASVTIGAATSALGTVALVGWALVLLARRRRARPR